MRSSGIGFRSGLVLLYMHVSPAERQPNGSYRCQAAKDALPLGDRPKKPSLCSVDRLCPVIFGAMEERLASWHKALRDAEADLKDCLQEPTVLVMIPKPSEEDSDEGFFGLAGACKLPADEAGEGALRGLGQKKLGLLRAVRDSESQAEESRDEVDRQRTKLEEIPTKQSKASLLRALWIMKGFGDRALSISACWLTAPGCSCSS